jgi:hypothetical protein
VEEVKISKSLGKPLDDYAVRVKKDGTEGAQQPHIALAKRMRAEGKEVRQGTRIDYVVVDGAKDGGLGVVLADDYTGEFDRFYMWEKLVYPATMRLCMAIHPDHDWKQYLKVRPKKPRAHREALRGEILDSKPTQVESMFTIRLCDCANCHSRRGEVLCNLGAVLARYPGDHRVVIQSTDSNEIDTEGVSVSPSPGLSFALRALGSGNHRVAEHVITH